MNAADLNKKFAIPNALLFEETSGGLVRGVVSTPAAQGDVFPQGAHVNQWIPHGQRPVLFTSSKSLFTPGKAIRGGVPIIFPWFGSRGGGLPGPAHGFARTMPWTVEATQLTRDGAVEITFSLKPNEAVGALGYSAFDIQFRVSLGASLTMELTVRNESEQPLTFEEALHTYLAIGDIHQVSVAGLEGTTFIDKTDGFQRKKQGNEPLRITKETDQVHLETAAGCVVYDPAWKRRIVVEKSGSKSTVVWNPWIEKTKAMADMAPDDWRSLICVESANAADDALTLARSESHILHVKIHTE